MNQHIAALLMLFSSMTHAKASDTATARQAAQARSAHELKVEAYQACLAAGKVRAHRKLRGATPQDDHAPGCVDPGSAVALSGATPGAPGSDKARTVPPRAASKS